MPFLVDGDNLLGTWPGRVRCALERRRLALELSRFGAGQGRRVVVVFDGALPEGLHFGADVHFAGGSLTADARILDLLGRESDRGGWVVVTSDRALGDRCRWLGARVERCDVFRRRLGGTREGEKPDRETDIDYWIERFGDRDVKS